MRVYLAGAIEAAPDGGKAWRRDLIPFLKQEFDAEVFDPAVNETDLLTAEEKDNFRGWKVTDYKRFSGVIKRIIDRDLDQLINHSDVAICYWDQYVLGGGGTHGEVTVCHEHGIPLYMVLGMPREDVSSWILGCATEVFNSFSELREYLLKHKPSKGLST